MRILRPIFSVGMWDDVTYEPKGEWKSGKSMATAINVFGILSFGTTPLLAVCCQSRYGNPVVMLPGAGGE